MKRIFIDANILIDFLSAKAKQKDQMRAKEIIYHCHKNLSKAFISTHSFMVLFHKLDSEFREKLVLKSKIRGAYKLFNVIPVDNVDLKFAFNSKMDDFEDAVQLSCAVKVEAEIIITKNLNDFYDTDIAIIPPSQFFDLI